MAIERRSRQFSVPKIGKISMLVFAVLLIISGIRAYDLFGYIFAPNVTRNAILLIRTNDDYKVVESNLFQAEVLESQKAFKWVAKKKRYAEAIKPGRYQLKQGMNTNELVNLLRSGKQSPVKVTFNNVRTHYELAGKVAPYFESDSLSFLRVFENEDLLAKYGFNLVSFKAMAIPNTYEMYWTTTPEGFVKRMHEEYQRFWNQERISKAEAHGLTPLEVATMASIVQEETNKNDEKATIAGVYLNRIKRGMALQADPTVKYALGDFSIRRISFAMLETNSPYNTYKNTGLPPGPICFPETVALEAVLNAENHQFLFFCAKEDLSGYHRFSRTLSEHNTNAARYHRALNALKIYN